MNLDNWCEHDEKIVRYTNMDYEFSGNRVVVRIKSWFCPECGVHGAASEMVEPPTKKPYWK